MIFKRKRQGKTNYKKRLEYLKSGTPRLVIRKSLKNILAQVIEYAPSGDKVIVSAHTKELSKKYGWDSKTNIPTAYLLGLLISKKIKGKSIKKLILDPGLKKPTKNSLIYSFLKGAVDFGLNIPHSKEVFPTDKRILGEHIKNFNTSSFEEVKNKLLIQNAR